MPPLPAVGLLFETATASHCRENAAAAATPAARVGARENDSPAGAGPGAGGAPIIVTGDVDLEDLDPDDFGGYEM